MDNTQNFNNYPTQNFNPLFFMNQNSYVNQNNNNFNQISLMNQMYNNINFNMNNNNSMLPNSNINDDIIDLFPYIKEEKKIIKFINSNNNSNSIKIPISISKSDLYSIADNYKSHPTFKFILSYKNIMIKEDESSIEEIPEGAEINIIEERPIPNTCYYAKLKKKYGYGDIRNIYFKKSNGGQSTLHFPGEATLSDVKISYYNKYGLNENISYLLYNGVKLEDKDERRIKDLTNLDITISVYIFDYLSYRKEFGKLLEGNVTVKIKEKKEIKNFKIQFGTLESTSKLYEKIDNRLCMEKKIQKLYLNNKEINRENGKSLKSLGIKENFNVVAEL